MTKTINDRKDDRNGRWTDYSEETGPETADDSVGQAVAGNGTVGLCRGDKRRNLGAVWHRPDGREGRVSVLGDVASAGAGDSVAGNVRPGPDGAYPSCDNLPFLLSGSTEG